MKIAQGKVPAYFDPDWDGKTVVYPRYAEAVAAGVQARQHVRPADEDPDGEQICLFSVDMQGCFCTPMGALFVQGAVEDASRSCQLLYWIGPVVTKVMLSVDGHPLWQIGFPEWWINPDGKHPEPGTMITVADLLAGKWIPRTELKWSVAYVKYLADNDKPPLIIWPHHGHDPGIDAAVVSPFMEAMVYWGAMRDANWRVVRKGTSSLAEHFSPLETDVPVDDPIATLNTEVLDMLMGYKHIVIVGQALSHCVLAFLGSVVRYFDQQSGVPASLVLVEDCTSPVVLPSGYDFMDTTQPMLDAMVAKGMHILPAAEVPSFLGLV